MLDNIIDMIDFIMPIYIGIKFGTYSVYPLVALLAALVLLYAVLFVTEIREGDMPAFVLATRMALRCLAITYPAIGHPELISMVWLATTTAGLLHLATKRAERIREIKNRPRPTTAAGRIKQERELMRSKRLFYRNPPKIKVPTYYI